MIRKLMLTAAFALASVIATQGAQADITVLVPSGSEGDGLRAAAADYAKLKGTKVEIVQAPYANVFEQGANAGADQIRRLRHHPDGRSVDSVFRRERPSRGSDALLQDGRMDGPGQRFPCRSRWRSAATPTIPARYVCLPYVGNAQMFFYDAAKFKEAGVDAPEDLGRRAEGGARR